MNTITENISRTRSRIVQSPERIKRDIHNMGNSAAEEKRTVAANEAKTRDLQTKITALPKDLLKRAGFTVKEAAESHLCCGSAGTYNLLQPEIAGQLRERKLGNIDRTGADLIAAGNIGCLTQLAGGALAVEDRDPVGEKGLQEATLVSLDEQLRAFAAGEPGHAHRHRVVQAQARGRALLGKRAGDYVEVTINKETREWKLVEVS